MWSEGTSDKKAGAISGKMVKRLGWGSHLS